MVLPLKEREGDIGIQKLVETRKDSFLQSQQTIVTIPSSWYEITNIAIMDLLANVFALFQALNIYLF